ncbi:MAG TPA: TetR/AcrR family transcriptional regulator [Mycobacteriales bacterium]|nr:TetR/AcrR family transcriptional regulator [Mycobacteriales bacterium]
MAALAGGGVTYPTRERIVDEAMRLFGQNGFRGTSVVQIEKAAGLSPGAGGLYHHFASKDDVLMEGVRRHLARLDALRQLRGVLTNLGDLRAELTVVARFSLAEVDSEAQLFQILASEARRRPDLLSDAAEQLVTATYAGFADWLRQTVKPRRLAPDRARTIALLAMGSLLSGRILQHVMGVNADVDDEALIAVWVDMVVAAIG